VRLNAAPDRPIVVAMSSLIGPDEVTRTAPQTPDRLSIWPLDDGRFGVDVTYEGATGYELASRHEAGLQRVGIPYSFRQELGGAWTVRLTIPRGHVATVVARVVGD
jgi:hypothetical protein